MDSLPAGEYEDTGPDGTPYYHVCPPAPPARIQLADGVVVPAAVPLPSGARVVTEGSYPPEARRDETVVQLGVDEKGAPVTRIRAEGLGRTLLSA